MPGDEMPMIPRQRVKIGADWNVMPKAVIGGDLLYVGAQRYVGDEANQNPKLPAYFTLGLHASYKVLDNVEFYARGENLLDRRYYLYGTYFDTTQLFAGLYRPAQRDAGAAALRLCRRKDLLRRAAPAPAAVLAKY